MRCSPAMTAPAKRATATMENCILKFGWGVVWLGGGENGVCELEKVLKSCDR